MLNIPIFLSSDDNYAPFVATTIASICDNTKSFVDIYVLDSGISSENKDKISNLTNQFNNLSIEFIEIDTEKYFKNFMVTQYISVSTYNRFLIPQLKPHIDKAIYLDVDIIVLGDISEMYNENLDGYPIGAAWEEYAKYHDNKDRQQYLDLSHKHQYFNAGVLLMDCKKWREENLTNKLFETEKIYREKLKYVDQDVLNKFFDNNYKIIPHKYNYLNQNYEFYDERTVIIRHFVGPIKPWQINSKTDIEKLLENTDIFWYYAKKTLFFEQLTSNFNNEEEQLKNIRLLKIHRLINKEYAKKYKLMQVKDLMGIKC